jgi:hypothetical protein
MISVDSISYDIKNNFNNWSFTNVFKHKGVQAICGTLNNKLDTNYPPVVYKVGAYPERSLEHEEYIMNFSNTLRSFSPHFVYLYDSKVLDINNKFIDSNVKYTCSCENCKNDRKKNKNINLLSLLNDSSSISPSMSKKRKVLFIEYVSNIHLKHALRANDDQLATCQLIMSLAAIQQGLEKNKFCHYDLHIDNILLKECNKNSYFAYRFKNGKTILTPTRGFYPVFIDFGTSFVHEYTNSDNKNNCKTPVINSHNGLQPTLFDSLVDAHQLVISSLFELEAISDRYYNISTLFFKEFISVPIFHETGWKRLPLDIFNIILDKLENFDENMEADFPIWSDQQSELIEMLSLNITLPFKPLSEPDLINICKKYNINFKNYNDSFDQCFGYLFKNMCTQITNIQRSLNLIKNEDNCLTNVDEIYYIIREIVESTSEIEAENIKNKYKMGKKCDTKKCWKLIKDLSYFLSNIYNQTFKTHESIIHDMYKNVNFKDPVDIAHFLQANTFCLPTEIGEVDIHCYDSINETSFIKKCHSNLLTINPTIQNYHKIASSLFD